MQVLQILKLILSLLPLILDTVRAIEAALPEGGNGSAKLALVREAISAGYSVASDAVTSFEQAWPAIEKVVGAAVTLFNTAGAFKK